MRGLLSVWSRRTAGDAATDLRTASLVDRVLAARGIVGPAAKAFLDPCVTQLHDPALMPGLEAAAARLLAALRDREAIAIYGDYDVDGVCAASILFHTLRTIRPDADIRTYVPHRLEEGYGLNAEALTALARAGAKVIVSVDCGVTAVAPARALRDAAPDVDLIITDHHNMPAPGETLPEAFAIVHPRLPRGSAPGLPMPAADAPIDYPFGELCGAGVAYKLAWRLATMSSGSNRADDSMRKLLIELLAFAAMGVVADIVPMLGENRVIARAGLRRIKRSPLPGMRELVAASGLAGEDVQEEDVGFKLGPRLNACGRMGHAREAMELFTTAAPERAAAIAADLTKKNNERRNVERRIFEQACEMAETQGMTGADRRAIVLAHVDWHAGVVGIVCSRLVERFHRPTLLLQRADTCHGSGRSIEGFSLHAALARCAPLLASFGGHDMAAGMKVTPANFDAFADSFIAVCNDLLAPADLVRRETYDAEATMGELTGAAVDSLRSLAPFGREHPEVRLILRNVRAAENAQTIGQGGKHLAVRASAQGRVLRFVGWGLGEHAKLIRAGSDFDAIVTPKINEWNGTRTVECQIVDLRVVR
jgi:single-stranded-DNA-specific exonuclease